MKNDLLLDVEKGDAITASGYNEVLDTIRQFQGLNGSMVIGGKLVTRPVVEDGAEAGTSLAWAMVTGDVAGFSAIDGSALTATPGKSTSEVVNLMQWDGADLKADDDSTTLYGLNASGTDIRASTAEPVLVTGFQEEVDGDECFTIVNVMDLRGLPGYAKGTDPVADMQIPYHAGNSETFNLDSEDCQP